MDWLKTFFKNNARNYAVWLLGSILVIILGSLGYEVAFPPPPTPIFETGWVESPEEVEAFAGTLKFKVFADTEAGKNEAALPSSFYLWDVVRKIDPDGPPVKNQLNVGSCVAFGTNLACYFTMASNIVLGNEPADLVDIVEEVTYAGSRVDVGKGRIRGDGSVGAWAAKYVTEVGGLVQRGVHGDVDLSKYDTARCRAWGDRGAPPAIKALAKEHAIRTTTLVKTWEEAKKAIAQGYGIAVCSNQGFTMRRDGNGVCNPSGSWAHCMCLDGYHTHTDGVEYGHISNSWGDNAHTGPVGWGNPTKAGFWTKSTTIDRMLKQGDSWAFSGVNGFRARNPDWFLQLPRTEEVRVASRGKKCIDSSFLLCP